MADLQTRLAERLKDSKIKAVVADCSHAGNIDELRMALASLMPEDFDTEYITGRLVGEAIGNETLEYGCDVVLGPGMNLHRNPLCGRNFEYYSEDPIVTGLIGTAFVQGVQSQGVGVSAKHFAVNSQETDRAQSSYRVPFHLPLRTVCFYSAISSC